ncbi:MAG: hypothetical protein MUC38_13425 [Cyclobacteriaceae bacterium]|jgi:hypothetical protein|nr:hypothetical protein [Cyclobacteriaceae bacterium]
MTTRLIVSLLLITTTVLAQNKSLDNYFAQIRVGKYANVPAEVSKPELASGLLKSLSVHAADTMTVVRARAAGLVRTIGLQSKVATVRMQAVQQLVTSAKDKDTGNAGVALNYLTSFRKNDFSGATKDSLYAYFQRKAGNTNTLIRLLGYLDVQKAKNDLFVLSQNGAAGRKDRWAALLALSRMGDEQAINDVMNRVKRMPVSDALVYEVFPDLVYTRRREAFSYLLETLNSDAKNCESADPERPSRIPCAYRVMEMLAPAIGNYPLKLSDSGDVVTSDYPAALTQVREWFKVNKEFKILDDKY